MRKVRDHCLRCASLLLATFALGFGASPMAAAPEASPSPWQQEIEALTADDTAHPPPPNGVLFVGSSSIRFWTTLAADFPGIAVLNRGFGGSMIADSTHYADRIVVPYRPQLIVFYAGDNDIAAGHTPAQVLADFQAFVARVRRDLPQVAIVFVSIKPSLARAAFWPQTQAANAAIAQWAQSQPGVRFVDVASRMLGADGKPRAELLRADGLHMSSAGYAIWVAALRPVLAEYGFNTH